MTPSSTNRQTKGLACSVIIGLGAMFWLLFSPGVQPQVSSVFASPLSTPLPRTNITYWGLHLGNHANGEPWDENLLKRIDGDKPGGLWPSVIVFPSFNLYAINRNESGDCKILTANGKYDLLTGTGTPRGYLQRAAIAGVKIFIRIMPSPGNFDAGHRLSLLPSPTNGNRCNIWPQYGGMRSYDDIGDEIIKIHEWNATHGITETGFLPANEPNGEWYDLDGPVQRDQLLAWADMDAYFTAVYTYVHAVLPYPAVSVFTPPMAQEAYAETKDINGCTDEHTLEEGGYGYEKMTKVFMTGTSNDGYAWNNYWKVGYEPWTPECNPDVTPHGHHVALWFPLQMINSMSTKPTIITEADLKSPDAPQHGNLANKDDQLGTTAATSIERFELAESLADDIAVWALTITNPNEPEQNWHEAYRCNNLGEGLPPLERPWFTRWWTGETPSYSVTPCYRVLLPVGVKDYPEELIKNGRFESGSAYWTVSRLPSCQRPMFKVYTDTNGIENYAAVLGDCQGNIDTLYQTVTIPSNATSAKLRYNYELITGYAGGMPTAYMDVFLVDGTTPHLLDHYDDSGYDPVKNVWQSRTIDLMSYVGKTVQVKFYASNSSAGWPAKFWVDNVSLLVEH